MSSPRVRAVIPEPHRTAECPAWEESAGRLLYVDINAKTVCRWDPISGEVQTVGLRDRAGCVGLCHRGSYVVASGTRLGLLAWDARSVQWAAWLGQDEPHNRFNDGKVDPAGKFVAGTMPEASAPGVWGPGRGALYALHPDLSVDRQRDRLGIPNGLDWSPDQRTFYHVDSLDFCVRAYDYDTHTGAVGTRLCTVELPVSRVTSCCFGGPDYTDLYVTSAADGLGPEQLSREPQARRVFKVTGLGAKGQPSHTFTG